MCEITGKRGENGGPSFFHGDAEMAKGKGGTTKIGDFAIKK